ncbi:hypothetical protein C922_04082 [Plasmodium inui San Antonio 1]|uniref:Uncharacterized protein n=1 Tax=Plasmodium inui San Antonio 1 TaxID=1237626 RepID=W7AJR4_9APIC|nr:hypothetical protein C922_04082 [Plasmodium inui San Antonio 1]EUD65576.1 hypothetical protein C922_04082 [Plasmodium inui San Antonio 1]
MNVKTSEDVYNFAKDCLKIKEEIDNSTKKIPKKEKKKNTCQWRNNSSKYNSDYSKFESCLKEIEENEELEEKEDHEQQQEQRKKSKAQENKQHFLSSRNPCTHDHSKERQLYEKESKEKIKASNAFNEEGKKAFYEKNYKLACVYFRKGLIQLDYSFPDSEQEQAEQSRLEINLHLNLATTKFHMSNYHECISECSTVLNLDKNNAKAHYRKGHAYMSLDMYSEAKEEFLKALEMNPTDNDVKKSILTLKSKIVSYTKREKLLCSKFFPSSEKENEKEDENLAMGKKGPNNTYATDQPNRDGDNIEQSDAAKSIPIMTSQNYRTKDVEKKSVTTSNMTLNLGEKDPCGCSHKRKEYFPTFTSNGSNFFKNFSPIFLLNNIFLYLLVSLTYYGFVYVPKTTKN